MFPFLATLIHIIQKLSKLHYYVHLKGYRCRTRTHNLIPSSLMIFVHSLFFLLPIILVRYLLP